MKRIVLLLTILSVLIGVQAASAAQNLPASSWYAVVWAKDTDTLHFINANGEQASIERPTLPNEADGGAYDLHVSPDGRYLVVVALLNGGGGGVGFYDLEAGQFMMTHQAAPSEFIVPSEHYPITRTSDRFVMSLHTPSTGAWRLIDFDLTTGHSSTVVNSSDPIVPQAFQNVADWQPQVAAYVTDEAINANYAMVRLVPPANAQYTGAIQAFNWYPTGMGANLPPTITTSDLPDLRPSGFDISLMTGWFLRSWHNTNQNPTITPLSATTVTAGVVNNPGPVSGIMSAPNDNPSNPRWLNGIQWVGVYVNRQPHQPHWGVKLTSNADSFTPLGPNITDLRGTPDGFLGVDNSTGRIYHSTTIPAEGFAASFGQTVFQTTPNSLYEIVYVTPVSTQFTLASLGGVDAPTVVVDTPNGVQAPQDDGGDPVVQGGEDIDANEEAISPEPIACAEAPAPRLGAGMDARVAYTNGVALNVRNAPAGDKITQLPEGTTFDVLDGPQCADNYHWYYVQHNSGNGWVAEGASGVYYIEPFQEVVVNPAIPTPEGGLGIQAPQDDPPPPPAAGLDIAIAPTVTPEYEIIEPLGMAPTPVPSLELDLNAAVVCNGSPQQRVTVGDVAKVVGVGGTLAMRTHLTDEYPSHQVQPGAFVNVLEGPGCHNNLRMWRVSTTINGQLTFGWVAEGFQATYYLDPNL